MDTGNGILDILARMVGFIGTACGEHCEVALMDLRGQDGKIIAIANGHISGRSVGSPLTALTKQIIREELWKTQDYVCNYTGKTGDHRILHSSLFFIKQEGTLLGLLSVNIDTSKYVALSDAIRELIGLVPGKARETPPEAFFGNLEDSLKTVLAELGMSGFSKEQFTQEDRLAIIERLLEGGIFMLRGSVSLVAEKLNCSEPSLYRYITVINKRNAAKKEGINGTGPKN